MVLPRIKRRVHATRNAYCVYVKVDESAGFSQPRTKEIGVNTVILAPSIPGKSMATPRMLV